MFVFRVEVSEKQCFCLHINIFDINVCVFFSVIKPGLDKSSSDVAAEGAILNEMLDIVAKRAALRANDPQNGMNSIESDVSPVNWSASRARDFLLKWLIPLVLSVLCMFYLHSAHL